MPTPVSEANGDDNDIYEIIFWEKRQKEKKKQ